MKVLIQLSGLDTGEVVPQKGRKGKSLEALLKERWAADRMEEEQDRSEQDRSEQDGATGPTHRDEAAMNGARDERWAANRLQVGTGN